MFDNKLYKNILLNETVNYLFSKKKKKFVKVITQIFWYIYWFHIFIFPLWSFVTIVYLKLVGLCINKRCLSSNLITNNISSERKIKVKCTSWKCRTTNKIKCDYIVVGYMIIDLWILFWRKMVYCLLTRYEINLFGGGIHKSQICTRYMEISSKNVSNVT